MNVNVLEITPQTGANTGGKLYQGVYQRADGQHRQAQVNHCPQDRHAGVSRLRDAVSHHGLHRLAFKEFFPHTCMVTKTGLSA
jgi:hypothetical protein